MRILDVVLNRNMISDSWDICLRFDDGTAKYSSTSFSNQSSNYGKYYVVPLGIEIGEESKEENKALKGIINELLEENSRLREINETHMRCM